MKYPTGWQIRTYSRPVGCCILPDEKVVEYESVIAWDEEEKEYMEVRINPDKQCIEPFGGTVASLLDEPKEVDKERSLKSSMNRTINRVYHLSRSNVWDWFFTLTFSPEKVDSFDYECCVKALKSWIDTIRRSSPDIKYILVPERHKSGRFHFHGLFANCDNLSFVESGHFTNDGQPIFNVGKYKLGFSTATAVKDNEKVTKYISKYITKDLICVAFGKKRYWASRNLDECECEEYIVEGADMPEYLKKLQANCKWSKQVVGDELTINYFEMGCPDESDC